MSTAGNLLNADVGEIGALLKRGFGWWLDELAAMVPDRWRRRRTTETVARIERGRIRVIRRGGEAVALDPATPVAAAVALDPSLVLVRDVALPRLGPADSRALLALDLDRLTPFSLDQVWSDFDFASADPADRLRLAQVAVVRREAAASAIDLAADAGVDPVAVGVATPNGIRFDFLPQIIAAVSPPPWWARPRMWWTAAAVLAAANVAFAVYRDSADVRRLEDLTAAQGDAVALAARLKSRVAAEDGRRAALVTKRETAEPLSVIAALSRAVPPPAWAQRLQWDGRRIELSGFAPAGADPVAAVRRDAAFRDVRAGASDIAPTGLTTPPFELSAQWTAAEAAAGAAAGVAAT